MICVFVFSFILSENEAKEFDSLLGTAFAVLKFVL